MGMFKNMQTESTVECIAFTVDDDWIIRFDDDKC